MSGAPVGVRAVSDVPPPNIAGSAAQAGFQQAEVAKTRDANNAGQGSAARRNIKAIDDAGATIETSDEDTAVFSDAEGAGGQGRSHEEESTEGHESNDQPGGANSGISTDSHGKKRLDIRA